jgi:hypothetical protein
VAESGAVRVGAHSGGGTLTAPGGRLASTVTASSSVEVRVRGFGRESSAAVVEEVGVEGGGGPAASGQ